MHPCISLSNTKPNLLHRHRHATHLFPRGSLETRFAHTFSYQTTTWINTSLTLPPAHAYTGTVMDTATGTSVRPNSPSITPARHHEYADKQ